MSKVKRTGFHWVSTALICFTALQLAGCSHSGSGSGGSGTGPSPDASLIGNWQFEATSSGTLPFSGLSGFVNEEGFAGNSTTTTASLQVQSTSCFAGTKVIDMEGFSMSPLAQLTSFPSNSQVVTLGLSQQCSNGVSLCGTYSVAGGCADQAAGSITGVKYATLTGAFSTVAGAAVGARITVNQSAQGTGQGGFQISGTESFTGVSCATAATIDPIQSSLSGSFLHLVSQTNATGNPSLTIDATINSAATNLTLGKITFASSNCFQSLNGASLSNTQ